MKSILILLCVVGLCASQNQNRNQNRNQNSNQNRNQNRNQNSHNQGRPPVAATTTQGPRLLSLPESHLCESRPKQWKHGGHNYYFSADQDALLGLFPPAGENLRKVDWLEARNQCRRRCMDAISMETEAEAIMVRNFMQNRNVSYIWTSGRLCDFKGCETRADLQPLNVLGWFWSNTNTKMSATNAKPIGWEHQPWSPTGHTNDPQPDNAEFAINQTPESCMAVLNDIYQDGIVWHDIACYHKKTYICEDSDLLLQYVKATNPGIVL